MKIFIDIGHPAHLHFFKHFMHIAADNGHTLFITARNKDVTLSLLEKENIEFVNRGSGAESVAGKIRYLFKANKVIYQRAREFDPDIFLSCGSPYLAHVATILNTPHITFGDTDRNILNHLITYPFSDAVLTPRPFRGYGFGRQVKFDGYKELAYLHPAYFAPDSTVLDELGVAGRETYVILRFVSWSASHDVNHSGFSVEQKRSLASELDKHTRVFISSESLLPPDLERHRIPTTPDRIHHAMAFASLLVGESATMASESAVLGVPAIYHDRLGRSYTDEQEERYGLVYNYGLTERDRKQSLQKAAGILSGSNSSKETFAAQRNKLLSEKIDVTAFMVWFVENYPNSKNIIANNANFQYRFC